MKYKVGDKVRIRTKEEFERMDNDRYSIYPREIHFNGGDFYMTKQMLEHSGNTVIITDLVPSRNGYKIKGNGLDYVTWEEWMFDDVVDVTQLVHNVLRGIPCMM